MASDLQVILPKLVRSGMWSGRNNLCRYKQVILDADSIATHLYRLCNSDQIRRQRSILSTNQVPDLYSASIVNYSDYCHRIKQLFHFMQDHNIEPVVVYSGKNLESNLYGPIAGEVANSVQRVGHRLGAIMSYDKEHRMIETRSNLPPLALNLFKLVSNKFSKANSMRFQAYYSSFPLMTKLARDLRCPVITNEHDFLLMDVRAGFILFEDFWLHHIELHNLATTTTMSQEQRSVVRLDRKSSTVSPKFSTDPINVGCTFHYNRLFLHQHPGLSPETVLYLYPLTNVDFVTNHAAPLRKLHIYDSPNKRQDFLLSPVTSDQTRLSSPNIYQKYHKAAKRLESALNYLCGKEAIVLENFIKGDATYQKRATGFGGDFRLLVSKYAVAHQFKQRLQFILKKCPYIVNHKGISAQDLDYVQACLTERECSPNFLVDPICSALGRMVLKSYNHSLAFEDLKVKKSAYSIANRAKSMIICLFNPPPQTGDSSKRGHLIIVDREGSSMAESLVDSSSDCKGSQLDKLREHLQLAELAKQNLDSPNQSVRLSAATAFINQTFMASDMRQLPKKLDHMSALNELSKDIKQELAIVMSAFEFCIKKTCSEDTYFRRTYTRVTRDFELALINHYIYVNSCHLLSRSKKSELAVLITKRDLENVALPGNSSDQVISNRSSTGESLASITGGGGSSPRQGSSKSSTSTTGSAKLKPTMKLPASAPKNSRMIRHLIEMLNVALGSYIELNAFLGYPLYRLHGLPEHYNPVLVYNLTLLSDDKALYRF